MIPADAVPSGWFLAQECEFQTRLRRAATSRGQLNPLRATASSRELLDAHVRHSGTTPTSALCQLGGAPSARCHSKPVIPSLPFQAAKAKHVKLQGDAKLQMRQQIKSIHLTFLIGSSDNRMLPPTNVAPQSGGYGDVLVAAQSRPRLLGGG